MYTTSIKACIKRGLVLRTFFIANFLGAVVANGVSAQSIPASDLATIYVNGDILTMDKTASNPDAIATKGGKIIALGTPQEVISVAGPDAIMRDLAGQTLLPGFIDAHGHISLTALFQASVNVSSPPVGTAVTVQDIVSILSAALAKRKPSEWLVGWGYDDSLLQEQRHPTRDDLDKVSTDVAIALVHVSGHLMACNSRCLTLAGISAATADPEGGVIRRNADTMIPNGVLEESATYLVRGLLPKATDEQRLVLLGMAQDYYSSHGITTVQDGAASRSDVAMLREAAARGNWEVDVVAYPLVQMPDVSMSDYNYSRNYDNGFRIGGVKLVLDGSPQGKTAFLSKPYLHPPHGENADYLGYPILPDATVKKLVDEAYSKGIPLIAHANGDAAADQLISAVGQSQKTHGKDDYRTVMIHAQTVREDQQDAMKALGMVPSYFSAHTFYWGDWHRDSVFGVERASRISPLQTTVDRGMVFTTHNDTPIVPPDMLRLVWASVNRVTRSGVVLGPDQRISPLQALRSVTINAAYQYFEEASKGSLEVGKIADLVILSANPTKVDPMDIVDIEVLETIKNGQTIYRAPVPQ